MKLGFLLTTWLIHVCLCFSSAPEEVETDIGSNFDAIAEEMLESLKISLSTSLNRQKRELGTKPPSLIDDSGVYRLTSVKPVAKLCYPAIHTLFIDVSNMTYAVCISAMTTDKPAEVVVGYYKDHTWIPFDRWLVNNAVDAAAFYFKDHIHILVTDSDKESGAELITINLKTHKRVMEHTVTGSYVTSISVWKMKITGRYNLAVANSGAYKNREDLSSVVTVYEWLGTYFDQYASFPAYDVKDIEPFHIHGAAYIAVANFRKSRNNYEVDSEILRYDQDGKKWISHQKIKTYGAMDWEFFSLGTSLGQEFFLAVANKGTGDSNAKSMIYKFVEDKFVPLQCLPTTSAVSFASYSVDGIFLLAVANENDAVHLYQYDGWRFIKSGVQYTRGAMSDGVVHLKFHKVTRNMEDALILSVSNPRHYYYQSVFEIGFFHENALDKWYTSSTDWCLSTLTRLEKKDVAKTFDFKDVIFTDQPSISISGDVIFEQGFVSGTLKTPKLTELSTEEVYDDNVVKDLANLHDRLQVIKEKLKGFSEILQNSLKVEGDQTIKGQLQFKDAVFSCGNQACHFENIHTEVLNGEEIGDWSNRLVFMDNDQFINGTIMAKDIKASNVHVFGYVDGVKSDTLVTKSGNYFITGHKRFNNLVTAADLEVSGKVDGVTISSDNVLLSTGHQTVTGNISFEDINTTWLRATFVNGINLTEFYNDLVLTDKSYEISGRKVFGDVSIDELFMAPGSTINGVDLVDLWNNAFWTDGSQVIPAEMTFTDIMMEKDLYATGGINGIQIPGPKVVDITEPAVITASKVFPNSMKIASLEVLGTLNGIPLVDAPDGSKQLDIMLKSGNQIVTGSKIFHTIHLDSDSTVNGLVDGVDLSEFAASVLRKNVSVITNGTWVFNSLLIRGPLTVEGKISNVDLKQVYDRALKLNDPWIPEITFKEHVYVEELQSESINDIDVKKDFVLKNGNQEITGKKTFEKIIIEEAIVTGLVNNMNFSFLNEVILIIGSQNVKSKVFKNNVRINHLTVGGTINGLPIEDIVTLEGGKIHGSRLLSDATFSAIEAGNVEVTGKVNNIALKEMIDDTMTYDGPQEVNGVKSTNGTIIMMNGTNLQTKDLNGINLQELWADAVFIDIPQEITGAVTFKENVVFDSLSFNGTIDGVSDWDMKYNWMLRNKPQTVEGNVEFQNGFSAKDLKVQTINGLDLHNLQSEIVKVNEASAIQGPVIFEKSIISEGNISLTGKVQGIDLSEEAVERHNVVVTGEKRFSQDVVIEGDLAVDGLINNIDLEDLCNKTFLRSRDVNISRLVIKGNVILDEGTVGGNLAGVDLSLLKDIAVRNDGSEIKLEGVKMFKNVTFEGPVTLKGKFGDVDLGELAANYMSISKDQEIPAKMEFDDLSFKGFLSVRSLDTANKEINGISLQRLNDKILRTSGTQHVTASYFIDEVHFANDLFVAGKVNGLELPSGVMRHNHTNYIQSPKVFEQTVIVQGNLQMEKGKTIQGVDVSDWFRKAVLVEGKFQIHGSKTFSKLQLTDVAVEGLFDTLKISEDYLLMTYGNQVITGRKMIAGSVSIGGSLTVEGLINAIDINELARTTLQRDRNNTVTGIKYFQQPLTAVSLQAPSVAGVDILALKEKLKTTVDLSELENKLEEIEGVVSHMQTAFDNQAILFQYYELFDEFALPSVYGWLYVSGEDCGELLLLFDNSTSDGPCSSIRILGFDNFTKSFIPARQELVTSNAVSVKSLMLDATYIFVANGNPNRECSDLGETTVDIYKWDVDSFKKLPSVRTQQPVDMVAFKDGVQACLVVLELDGSKVYCRSQDNQSFAISDVLFTRGGQKVSVVHSHSKIILAIAAEDALHLRENYVEGQRSIDIYIWDSTKMQFSTPRQYISSTFTQSLALMKHGNGDLEEVFFAIAEGSIPRIHNKPKIAIFKFDHVSETFFKHQEIEDYGTLEWISLKTGELLLFAVDSQHGQINVYQYKGVSGFLKIDAIKSLGTTNVHAFSRSDPEDWLNHYLALAGPYAMMAQPTQDGYYAKILKSKVKGKRLIH